MEIPDLHTFPAGHGPTPAGCPVSIIKVGEGALPPGLKLCSVGWLERANFNTGPVLKECVEALAAAHGRALFSDGSRGVHTCTLCGASQPRIRWRRGVLTLKGHGHYLIRHGDTVFMAPELILHYIRSHRYCPPSKFVNAVLKGMFLTEDDLVVRWQKVD